MGGELYWYVVPFQADIDAALQSLRRREFEAGRYNPVMPFISFPIGPASPAPGKQHRSYDEAMEAADADGTRSIIDITAASLVPNDGEQAPYQTAWPLEPERLAELFGTQEPSLEDVQNNDDFWEDIERGTCVYVVLYRSKKPHEIFFAGYSFD